MVTCLPLFHNFKVVIENTPLSISNEQEIEYIWKDLRQSKGLFNAPLFCFISYAPSKIVGRFVDFKYYAVQKNNPALFLHSQLTPLSVSGVTTCSKNKILLGKRSDIVFEYPNMYEFVPSGSIDKSSINDGKIDVMNQLLQELEEETGIKREVVTKKDILGLYYSEESRIYDIVIALRIEGSNFVSQSSEYTELKWMTFDEVNRIMNEKQDLVVPLTLALWKSNKII